MDYQLIANFFIPWRLTYIKEQQILVSLSVAEYEAYESHLFTKMEKIDNH